MKEEKVKGEYLGECNRTICSSKNANYYNHSTRKYYCASCTSLINRVNAVDAKRIFGHDLCTKVELQENEF